MPPHYTVEQEHRLAARARGPAIARRATCWSSTMSGVGVALSLPGRRAYAARRRADCVPSLSTCAGARGLIGSAARDPVRKASSQRASPPPSDRSCRIRGRVCAPVRPRCEAPQRA